MTKEEQIIADQIRSLAPTLSPTAIGIEIGIHQSRVVRIAGKAGIALPHHVKKVSFEETYEKHIKYVKKYHDVHTAASLCRKVGVSESTLRRMAKYHKKITGESIRFKTIKRKPKTPTNGEKVSIKIDNSLLFKSWISYVDDTNRNAIRVF